MSQNMRLADGGNGKALARRVAFTAPLIQRATCPAGKARVWLYDTRTPGLALMVTQAGTKSFYVYKKIDGRPERIRLGGFPEISVEQARKLAAVKLADIANGRNPQTEKRAIQTSMTLQSLFDKYTGEYAPRLTERTRVSDKSRFDTCFAGWKTRKLASIREADVRSLHATIGNERGQVTANRAMQLLRRLFGWARIEPNPVRKGTVDYFGESQRDRFMSGDELPRFFAALDAEPNETIRDYVKLSLWTGARRSNVQSMRWDELNMQTLTWRIPAGKSKSGEPMDVHLSAPAIEVLTARLNNGSEYVLPGRKAGHLVEPKAGWRRILKTAGINNLRLHDLRRTLGSWQAATGASLHVIGKSLGHHDVSTTSIYARLDLAPVRQSVDAATTAMLKTLKTGKSGE